MPLAISAAVYPPALLVRLLLLTGEHPRRLVLAYYGGAAILTISAGLIVLAVLKATGVNDQGSTTASGWFDIVLGVLLLALAPWAWRRRAGDPDETPKDAGGARGRIARWSRRATTSQKWAFVLGLAMFLPSPLYILAVKDIADSSASISSTSRNRLASSPVTAKPAYRHSDGSLAPITIRPRRLPPLTAVTPKVTSYHLHWQA